ncbi:coiled-coil domain-containing protein mad1 [Lecanora helva]
MAGSRIAASRIANTQPTYDFLSGGASAPTPVKPLGQSRRQESVVKAGQSIALDIGNEDLRAQVKTLQYELDSLKQDRELAAFRHDKELRDVQSKTEEIYRKAQAEESSRNVPSHKYEALRRELKDSQDQAINQQNVLEKKLRTAQDECRAAKEESEEVQTESESIVRQNQYQLKEVETKCAALQQTLSNLQDDLVAKSSALKTTQDRLTQQESQRGELESEILRLKAQTGDADTLAVIKRELSEQVSHIRKLESTNREQNGELKHFRKVHKAVEVVEEEKNALKSKLRALEDTGKQLREAQLQRQILEDEKKSWTSYLQNDGGTEEVEFESPEDMAKALATQRLENTSLLQRMGQLQPEITEKDEIIKSLEEERGKIHAEMEKLRATGGGAADNRAKSRLERQRALAIKEVDYLREQLRTFDSEEQTYHTENQFDIQKVKRIFDLETLVDEHRRELQTLNSEFEKLEKSNPAPPQSPLKRPREDDPEDHQLGQLSRKNRKLQDTLSTLQSSHAVLQSQHSALQTQLSSLQESAKTRVLSLRSNPTADYAAIQQTTLNTLRRENADLLATLSTSPSSTATAPKLVPWSVLEAKDLELASLNQTVADKEKRMLRLKQIWGNKSLELREAIFSLLGWKMEFRPNGKFALSLNTGGDVGEEGAEVDECLVFDGENGTMKVAGGMESAFAGQVRPLIREWVEGRKFIPGLMASILLMKVEEGTVVM